MSDDLPNFPIDQLLDDAKRAAGAIHNADAMVNGALQSQKTAIHTALCKTMRLIEHWHGPHRADFDAKKVFGKPYPGTDDAKAVLMVVNYVFNGLTKQRCGWFANALRQAWIKDQMNADNIEAYFLNTPATTAAKAWAESVREKKPKPKKVDVPIKCELPEGVKVTEKGTMVRLCKRAGKLVLEMSS